MQAYFKLVCLDLYDAIDKQIVKFLFVLLLQNGKPHPKVTR